MTTTPAVRGTKRDVKVIARELQAHAYPTPNWYRCEMRCSCGAILDQWAQGTEPPGRAVVDTLHQEHTAEYIAAALEVAR